MKKQELRKLEVTTLSKLRQAIKKGEKKEALARLEELWAGTTRLRKAMVEWIDTLMMFISERLGEEAVEDALRVFSNRTIKTDFSKELREPDAEERMKRRAYIYTGVHNVKVSLLEDEEKFTLSWPCDTGGQLTHGEVFGKTSRAYPWSNSQAGVAYYCAHCTTVYEIMSMEQFGFPNHIVIPPAGSSSLCTHYFFKDPKNIPEKYYEMFGMGKK
jgi:hypothetical protein